MMNIAELSNGVEIACNEGFRGVFTRRRDGSWYQHTGTCQTPRFRDPNHLVRWVRSNLSLDEQHPWRARRLPGGWR